MVPLTLAVVVDVLGEMDDDKPNIFIAMDVDTAAYKQDNVRDESFLSLLSVKGSKTGSVRVLQITDMSLTSDCKLKKDKNLVLLNSGTNPLDVSVKKTDL